MKFSNLCKIFIFVSTNISPTLSGREKIEPSLLGKIEAKRSSNKVWDIIVEFEGKTPAAGVARSSDDSNSNSSSTPPYPNPEDSLKRVQELEEEARNSQSLVWGYLSDLPKQPRSSNPLLRQNGWTPLTITNSLYIPGADASLIRTLSEKEWGGQSNITLIREEFVTRTYLPSEATQVGRDSAVPPDLQVNWGRYKTGAPLWWKAGYEGHGVIVGHIDNGADIRHPEFNGTWVGKEGGWKDFVLNTTFPWESDKRNSHGTHTLGTFIGKSVGMAPKARWISCIGCFQGLCMEHLEVECAKFMICPNPKNKCKYKPSIVSCSWGYPYGVQNTNPGNMDKMVLEFRKHNIIPVFAAGNAGHIKGCGGLDPPSDMEEVIGVGASDFRDFVAPFSNRGPPIMRYPQRVNVFKPDFVAPGHYINSSADGGKYQVLQGTSMAAPHVAGIIAVLLSRNEGMTKDEVIKFLRTHALKNTSSYDPTRLCGYNMSGVQLPWDDDVPNFKRGYGRITLPDPAKLSINFPPKLPTRELPPPPDCTGLEEQEKFIKEYLEKQTDESEDYDEGGSIAPFHSGMSYEALFIIVVIVLIKSTFSE